MTTSCARASLAQAEIHFQFPRLCRTTRSMIRPRFLTKILRLRRKHVRMRVFKNLKRSNAAKLYTYYGTYPLVLWLRHAPVHRLSWLAAGLGALGNCMMRGRRKIAVSNLRSAYRNEKDEREIKRLAGRSTASFVLSIAETIRFHGLFEKPGAVEHVSRLVEGLDDFLAQAKGLHERGGGCIFVTPHLGCYGMLPYLFSAVGVRIVIPLGAARNDYIERRWCPFNMVRRPDGEIFVPKTNSLNALKSALRQGRSVGMMPDQRTMHGVPAKFFGVSAPTTPVPALLAAGYQRPIVVGACFRKAGARPYSVVLCEPVWPQRTEDRKAEIVRLTREINLRMEELIRKAPEQYLWLHDRWKPYRADKTFLDTAGNGQAIQKSQRGAVL
jgi:Kdo2-lipid IVA lauroyltransferase/acyltransferase